MPRWTEKEELAWAYLNKTSQSVRTKLHAVGGERYDLTNSISVIYRNAGLRRIAIRIERINRTSAQPMWSSAVGPYNDLKAWIEDFWLELIAEVGW